MKSKQRIMFGCYAMILAIIGDYLLGYGTIGTSSNPDAYMGVSWNVAPDWRYAVSSVLGFVCAAMFAYAATELLNLIAEGLDSGTESLGWLMLYLVCALCLTGKKDIKATEVE